MNRRIHGKITRVECRSTDPQVGAEERMGWAIFVEGLGNFNLKIMLKATSGFGLCEREVC
ncbi:hypothetical protein PAHAL_8G144100 [Panicum hallii]|jgi:hypothetical protein|uniref:Uncharacterized protein n=1 Tax=Panicum hallii TaxID=206008 RepID=A0A2T8I8W2_9POAL|nr:hypothetical protein PAHAL_8G144100 [Panicum hallii]